MGKLVVVQYLSNIICTMVKEIEISEPIENYLEELGYRVRSEVKGCDITAVKGDEFIVIECKTSLSLKLIYQCVDRQEFCDSVYLALPILDNKKIPNRKYLLKLLKRLELGLITVTFLKCKKRVDIVLEPKAYKKKRKIKHRAKIMNEIHERSGNYNRGGSVGRELMTAYRERAIEIATLLNEHGSMTTPELKKMGTCLKTYTILYNNHYGWFFKDSGRGRYGLSLKGKEALLRYSMELGQHSP